MDAAFEPRPGLTHRDADWADLRVVVTGLAVSGFAAADALMQLGATLTVIDASTAQAVTERAHLLGILGATTLIGDAVPETLPECDLLVTSPGWAPSHPYFAQAADCGTPVWGEVELAWRLRRAENPAPWITLTGTNGKTTTVRMVESILRAAGLRATSAGNVGTPIVEAVMHPDPFEVIAVELSSFQLHWQRSLSPLASACLNLAEDHVDWHGSFDAYRLDKARVYENTQVACVYNVQDPATEQMVMDADVIEGCRAVGFTTGIPAISMVGVVDDILADRAFVEQRRTSAAELCTLDVLQRGELPPAPHVVANAVAAAALARAYGVSQLAVRDGLQNFEFDGHRIAEVLTSNGVTWINDSKATNPHATAAALAGFEKVVWIAGGLLKGADIEPVIREHHQRLRSVITLGKDRALIANALARLAPHVPVHEEPGSDAAAMDRIVAQAKEVAQPGDVVLLAPAAASMDMFANYGARGDAFAEAVRRAHQG